MGKAMNLNVGVWMDYVTNLHADDKLSPQGRGNAQLGLLTASSGDRLRWGLPISS